MLIVSNGELVMGFTACRSGSSSSLRTSATARNTNISMVRSVDQVILVADSPEEFFVASFSEVPAANMTAASDEAIMNWSITPPHPLSELVSEKA